MFVARMIYHDAGVSADHLITKILNYPCYPRDRVIVDHRRNRVVKFVTALAVVDVTAVPKDENCPICRAPFEEAVPEDCDHAIRKTACGHLYGHDCLVGGIAAAGNLLCSLCRQDMAVLGKPSSDSHRPRGPFLWSSLFS